MVLQDSFSLLKCQNYGIGPKKGIQLFFQNVIQLFENNVDLDQLAVQGIHCFFIHMMNSY